MASALCGNDNVTELDVDDDVHERLLRPQERSESRTAVIQHDSTTADVDDAFTHEELLHSIGSFSAVVWPVTVTMLIASLISINVHDPASATALANAYLVYSADSDTDATDSTRAEQAIANALVIVSFFLVATFVVVACYKYNFNRILLGYMMFSSAMLLGLLGGNIVLILISQWNLTIDSLTFWISMYNFAAVGVIAVFYQKGTPTWLAQIYLVLTSIIMAWQIGQFPEWSTWALVVVLAFYDLCAVLTPCGPLKWLVHLVQQEGRPLPGLLYEAEVKRERQSYSPPRITSTQTRRPIQALSTNTVQPNQYYQCESEIPLRLSQTPTTSSSSSHHNKVLKHRLIQFYERHNPAAIPRIDRIIEQYRGMEDQLWLDLHTKYMDVHVEGESTIKLGLGDFVFYSVLVSRAAMFDFAAMIGCLVSVLMGLGGTLFLLGIYKKALPALPISILIAVIVYFWMRGVYFPLADLASDQGVTIF